VFLCHNSADKASIKEIADRLELDFGILHFLDAFDIPTGEAFRIWIERALQESTGCAIFLGANGWGPTHRWEAEQAIARRTIEPDFRLIPVALPGVKQADMNALGDGSVFRDLNWADFRNGIDDQNGLDKLYAALTGSAVPEGRGPARLTPYQIRRDAARWAKSHQRDTSILYRGAQLDEADRLTRNLPELATKAEVAPFLLASARHQRTVWRRVAVSAVAVSLIVATLAVLAEVFREVAEHRRVLALSRSLAIESRAESVPQTALLLAAQAYAEVQTPELASNLLERLQTWRHLRTILHGNTGALTKVVVDGSGSSITAGSSNGSLLRWSMETPKAATQRLRASTGAIRSLAIQEAEGLIWAGYEDGRVLIWDKEGKRTPVAGLPPGLQLEGIADVNSLGLGPPVEAIALSRDGALAAVGTARGTGVGLVFLIDPHQSRVLGPPISVGVPRVNALDFEGRSHHLAAGTGFGTVVLIDTQRRTTTTLKAPQMSEILAVRFAGDRTLIAVDDVGRTAVWQGSGASFELIDSFRTTDYLTAASIRPDGKMVALGDAHGALHLFSLATHRSSVEFQAHTGSVNGLGWNGNANYLISTGSDGAADVWDFGRSSPLASALGRLAPRVLTLRAIGSELVAGRSSVGSAGVWQWSSGRWSLKLDLLQATLASLGQDRFEPVQADNQRLTVFQPVSMPEIERIEMDHQAKSVAWATRDGAVLWSELGRVGPSFLIHDGKNLGLGNVTDLSIGQSGHYLAIGCSDRRLLLYDLGKASRNGTTPVKEIDLPQPARSVNFNRAETMLAAGLEDGSIGLWSVPDGTVVTPPRKIHPVAAGNVTFALDDSRLFSNAVVGEGTETSLTASALPSLSPAIPLVAGASGDPPAMITVGKHLITTIDNDGRISFWDGDKLQHLGSMAPSDLPVSAAAFEPASQRLIIADEDGWIQALETGGAKWQTLACSLINRPLTREEWHQFLAGERYVPACDSTTR
jgi:WD40 repeat protein